MFCGTEEDSCFMISFILFYVWLWMIKTDRNKSLQERRDIFLNKVGNPYLVRIGNMKVKVRFANNGISMEQAFENMLLSV